MYAATWRTLSPTTPHCAAKVIAGRRRVPRLRTARGFRSFAPLLQQGPSDPPPSSSRPSKEQRDEISASQVRAAQGGPQLPEDGGGGGVGVEPEAAYVRKLQEARAATRRYGSALRKVQRRRQKEDLPPIHFPAWFLDRNVTLRERFVPEAYGGFLECELVLEDGGTGAALTSLRFPFDVHRLVYYVQQLGERFSEEEIGDVLLERLAAAGLIDKERENIKDAKSAGPLLNKDQDRFNRPKPEGESTFYGERGHRYDLRKEDDEAYVPSAARVNPWTLAEIKATIAGCLEGIRPEDELSYAASRTHLALFGHGEQGKDGEGPLLAYDLVLRKIVENTVGELGANLIRVDAQDIAELLGEYVGDGDSTSELSLRNLSFYAYEKRSAKQDSVEEENEDEAEEANEEEEDIDPNEADNHSPRIAAVKFSLPYQLGPPGFRLSRNLNLQDLFASAIGILPGPGRIQPRISLASDNAKSLISEYEEMKVAAWIDALLDIPSSQRQNDSANEQKPQNQKGFDVVHAGSGNGTDYQSINLDLTPIINSRRAQKISGEDSGAENTAGRKQSAIPISMNRPNLRLLLRVQKQRPKRDTRIKSRRPKTVLLIENFDDILETPYGSIISEKLHEAVQKRKTEGEQILVIGTDWSDVIREGAHGRNTIVSAHKYGEKEHARAILVPINATYPPIKYRPFAEFDHDSTRSKHQPVTQGMIEERQRNIEINLRHIQSVLRSLYPTATKLTDSSRPLRLPFRPPAVASFEQRILSFDEVHRIAVAAIGIHKSQSQSTDLEPIHINLALVIIHYSDESKFVWTRPAKHEDPDIRHDTGTKGAPGPFPNPGQDSRLASVRKHADQYEKRLISGVINSANIKTTFADVHAAPETVDALKTLTTLSLLRPDAFRYGVLATDKIPGLLLYGPPGTGKTLLAKAVAKESGATVLEVSGSEIYDMYVGEGEKNVRAVFSLARKLSPCVVFLDEADAILGSRSSRGNRGSHREIINQFLKEWDGMNDLSVFIMVATNRPFDLDDAVLRRLPRRLLVDLPTQGDRENILKIHLKGEALHDDLSLSELAAKTPLYSGSDLKNLCVAAALACVKEENEAAAVAAAAAASETAAASENAGAARSSPGMPKLVFPEKRILRKHHFDKALQEISASISEDMSSLGAIRRFDEKYGDRGARGRRRAKWGFTTLDPESELKTDENAARVRK